MAMVETIEIVSNQKAAIKKAPPFITKAKKSVPTANSGLNAAGVSSTFAKSGLSARLPFSTSQLAAPLAAQATIQVSAALPRFEDKPPRLLLTSHVVSTGSSPCPTKSAVR